ncbi:hypothetical protein D3C85_1503440 [compost metagenome]
MPKAISKLIDPVEIDSIASTALSPNFITVPLPYDFSNLSKVSCSAFNLSAFTLILLNSGSKIKYYCWKNK